MSNNQSPGNIAGSDAGIVMIVVLDAIIMLTIIAASETLMLWIAKLL
jgi:hypothetical protein